MDLHEFYGDPIHTYTRAQAITDGVLVDVTPTATEAGFRLPAALTAGAWAAAVVWDPEHEAGQDERGRLWDVLVLALHAARRALHAQRVRFTVAVVPNTPDGRDPQDLDLVVHVGPGDAGEPVVTVLLPDED